ncbi:MAG TPA: hypothetical protein VNR87_15565 [Flavisolibacter sp.]|nr:hypothetical protein [Flavisolibacter sp.]
MKSILTNVIQKGKVNKGDPKRQAYISAGVIAGFIILFIWSLILYPKTFVPLPLLLAILLLPGLILTFFISGRLLTICGYAQYIKHDPKYNSTIAVLAYMLITVPVGNFLVCALLFVNSYFANAKNESILLRPNNVAQSYSRSSRHYYSHCDITIDGITKRLNFGRRRPEEISSSNLRVEISRGYFGYFIIRKRRLE